MDELSSQHNVLHTTDVQLSNVVASECSDSDLSATSEDPLNNIEKFEIENGSNENINDQYDVPDMWSTEYLGLYSQYAAVGLLYGSSGAVIPFCVYGYDGDSNLCANSKNIMFFAWSFKIFFAILTDCYYPFGYRRKAWMLAGWFGVLVFLFVLAVSAHLLTVSGWLGILMLVQGCVMLSDVPADGYCVELGKRERPEHRGQILATGQLVRFSFCVVR